MVATSFYFIFPKAHLTPRASKEVAFSYDHLAGLGFSIRYGSPFYEQKYILTQGIGGGFYESVEAGV
jgi:hypothetical protein